MKLPKTTTTPNRDNRKPHVSELVSNYLAAINRSFPITNIDLSTYAFLGSAFDHELVICLQRDHPNRFLVPGEIECNGILGTPDLLDLESDLHQGRLAVWEIKLSWMSSSHLPGSDNFLRYELQLMAYCHLAQTLHGVLAIMFVNGDYASNRAPEFKTFPYRFTAQMLASNWALLTSTLPRDMQP